MDFSRPGDTQLSPLVCRTSRPLREVLEDTFEDFISISTCDTYRAPFMSAPDISLYHRQQNKKSRGLAAQAMLRSNILDYLLLLEPEIHSDNAQALSDALLGPRIVCVLLIKSGIYDQSRPFDYNEHALERYWGVFVKGRVNYAKTLRPYYEPFLRLGLRTIGEHYGYLAPTEKTVESPRFGGSTAKTDKTDVPRPSATRHSVICTSSDADPKEPGVPDGLNGGADHVGENMGPSPAAVHLSHFDKAVRSVPSIPTIVADDNHAPSCKKRKREEDASTVSTSSVGVGRAAEDQIFQGVTSSTSVEDARPDDQPTANIRAGPAETSNVAVGGRGPDNSTIGPIEQKSDGKGKNRDDGKGDMGPGTSTDPIARRAIKAEVNESGSSLQGEGASNSSATVRHGEAEQFPGSLGLGLPSSGAFNHIAANSEPGSSPAFRHRISSLGHVVPHNSPTLLPNGGKAHSGPEGLGGKEPAHKKRRAGGQQSPVWDVYGMRTRWDPELQ